MKAKLVHSTGRQRWYKLSEPISRGICDLMGPIDDIGALVERSISRSMKYDDKEKVRGCFREGIRMVCVSDALTHVERLVFPAFYLEGVGYDIISSNIDGIHTAMVEGCDSRTVHCDETYLRHLCILNKLEWEGFEHEEQE